MQLRTLGSLLLYHLIVVASNHLPPIKDFDNSPLLFKDVLYNTNTLLPCNLTNTAKEDHPILVLFYRDDNKTPVFSLDSRNTSVTDASFWVDPLYEDRLFLQTGPGEEGFLLKFLTSADSGQYRCRVDFQTTPTRNLRVRLRVVEPVQKMVLSGIWNEKEMIGEVVGPYPEHSNISLLCKVSGGTPFPNVTWWEHGIIIDNEVETRDDSVLINHLQLKELQRNHLKKVYVCKASNTDLMKPIIKSIRVNIAFPPKSVHIALVSGNNGNLEKQSSNQEKIFTVEEGEELTLECIVKGSKPAPIISWKIREKILNGTFESPRFSRKTSFAPWEPESSSFIILRPTMVDNMADLVCTATHSIMPNRKHEDSVRLNVLHKPYFLLSFNTSNVSSIQEGETLILKCEIKSNPAISQLQWTHNDVPVKSVPVTGFVDSSAKYLVIENITAHNTGTYLCLGANTMGSTSSNKLNITVRHAPKCSSSSQSIGVALHEKAVITCDMSANPKPKQYRWVLETQSKDNSSKTKMLPFSSKMIEIIPRDISDYGTLFCFANNTIGSSKSPCDVTIFLIDKPKSVGDCRIHTKIKISILKCSPGWNGGLPQRFTCEVRKANNPQARAFVDVQNQIYPEFKFTTLIPATKYLFTITASNSRGTSEPLSLIYKVPQERHSRFDFFKPRKKFALFLGEFNISIIICIVISLIGFVALLCVIKCLVTNYISKHRNAQNRNS